MSARASFVAKMGLSTAFALAVLATLLVPNWIELGLGVDLDHGDGEAEWGTVVVLGLIAIGFLFLACLDWRRAGKEADNV